jgi:hypothetical protein
MPPPRTTPQRRAKGSSEHKELHLHLSQLVRRRPQELMRALVDYDDTSLEEWLQDALAPFPEPPPTFAAEWLVRIGDMRQQLLRDSLAELEAFRRQRHYFDGRLKEALGLLRGEPREPSTDAEDVVL